MNQLELQAITCTCSKRCVLTGLALFAEWRSMLNSFGLDQVLVGLPSGDSSKVHSAFHPFVVGKMSTSITGDKLCIQRDRSGAHPCRESRQMPKVTVEAIKRSLRVTFDLDRPLASCSKRNKNLLFTVQFVLFLICQPISMSGNRNREITFDDPARSWSKLLKKINIKKTENPSQQPPITLNPSRISCSGPLRYFKFTVQQMTP